MCCNNVEISYLTGDHKNGESSVLNHSYEPHLGRKLCQPLARINFESIKTILIIRAYIILKHQIMLKPKKLMFFMIMHDP